MFVLVKNDFVGIYSSVFFIGEHNVISIRSLEKVAANLLPDLAFVTRLVWTKRVITLEDDDRRGGGRINSQFRKHYQQRLAKLLELCGYFSQAAFVGVADHREVFRLYPGPVVLRRDL